MAKLDLRNTFKDISFEKPEMMLGKGAMMPFNASNSGSRKLMFGTHLEQRLPLSHPDVPYIQTGYEYEFGKYSSSFILAEWDYEIFDKVIKYSSNPQQQYYLIAIDHENKVITVFERKEYKHITESYGYIYSNNSAINHAEPGTIIPKGSPIAKSASFDEYNNRMDGKNLLTIYTSCEETMEDAIVISESAAQALTSPLIKKVTIQINDNDIPLNLYGDENNYKVFPDIGEETEHGILAAVRVEKKEESLYSLSYNRLREPMISDDKYTASGRVASIEVYSNAPDKFIDNPYYTQIYKYYQGNLAMCQQIVDDVETGLKDLLDNGYVLDYEMQKLYSKCKGTIEGKQYYYNGKVFSNLVVEITLIDEIPILRGDKLTNRYGGKGITAKIRADDMMPRTKDGKRIDVLLNICGVYGRENAGQLFELSVSYICMKLVEYFKTDVYDAEECIEAYLTLLRIVSPSMYTYMSMLLDNMNDDDRFYFVQGMMDEDSIYMAIEPMSENMTLERLDMLYEEFPWIKMENILVPIIDSMGNIRYVDSRRPVVYGYLYFYRLKQYAEEKFSVTSLSSTNIKNQNTRNKASNNYRALYSRTPIRFGEMEIGNMSHMGTDLVAEILMIYSSSPSARRLCAELETGDPFNVDIRLDMDSKNRNAEILNVYLKTKGLRLVFEKRLKVRVNPVLIDPMVFHDKHLIDPIILYKRGIETWDHEKAIEEFKRRQLTSPIIIDPIEYHDEQYKEEKKEKDSAG